MATDKDIQSEFSKMILSASGWRKIFAAGGSEDSSADIKHEDALLVCLAAVSFAEFLTARYPETETIVIGRDARPTGAALQETFVKALVSVPYTLEVIGCAAAPEIMAYAKKRNAAFIYISASHNPIGYNGIKFGSSSGGVLNAEQAKILIDLFSEKCASNKAAAQAERILTSFDPAETEKILSQMPHLKRQALCTYHNFSKEVISGSQDAAVQRQFFDRCKTACENAEKENEPVCIVCDFNGSARAASIDRSFFEECGIKLIGMAEKDGDIRHAILPEGENLMFCAAEMERLRKNGKTLFEKNCFLGYMPDCDGDRGNIIYWSLRQNKALILEAQEVFALSVTAELAYLAYLHESGGPIAVAVNGPTSLRIEEIAACFGAQVFRAEVGEANVVNRAAELRAQNYTVRILGEGSNGGNITHPASVRDPLNTIFAILKFFLLKSENGKKGLFEIWCEKSNRQKNYKPDFSLDDIIETLPRYATTPTGESRAMLKITSQDHSALKRQYQKIFEKEWAEKRGELHKKFGIASYRSFCNNGTVQKEDIKDFGLSQKGGLKIQFYDTAGEPVGFIWMRGSGTEPVFRIMADIKGGSVDAEKYLAEWQDCMVKRADTAKG